MFQSTPPHGGRLGSWCRLCGGWCFNPRPHTGGDVPPWFALGVYSRFNPRPHTGGDGQQLPQSYTQYVSIHAPTRGATNGDVLARHFFRVSIHAPTRGATYLLLGLPSTGMFQSTPPHGGRQRWSAFSKYSNTFQSTPPHGGRLGRFRVVGKLGEFQSTPPHGGRLYVLQHFY